MNFKTFKDHVVFEKDEVLKDDGKPYTVYTPYSKKWKSRLTQDDLYFHEVKPYFNKLSE
jgi:deoxyribodipyrimidine photo-lyase